MHELSMAEGLLQVIEEAAHRQGYQKVRTVWVEVGKFAGVDAEALKFCFEIVAKNSLAANAALEIIPLPLVAWCLPCGKTVGIDLEEGACVECGSRQVQISGGQELRVKEVEVE